MLVLGIMGSPRREANTEILLDRALQAAKAEGADIEKIILNELQITPCQACGGCDKTGICIINDRMQDLYGKLDQADGLILASPIFFGSLPAQVKAMVDRYQCRWQAKYVLKKKFPGEPKKGYLILTGASEREDFFKNAESITRNFFAVAGVQFARSLYCFKVEQKAEILQRADCLEKAQMFGEAVVKAGQ